MTDHELRGEHTSLRPATDADLALLVGWFADPGVYAHWDGAPKAREEVVAEGYTGSDRPATGPFIVEAAGAPVGSLQCCPDGAASGGIDLFLVPAARGRGLGPDAARALVRYLLEARGWRRVTVDPAADNARALRAWARAGFVYERDWPDHPDGPAVLMAIEAAGRAGAPRAPPGPPSTRVRPAAQGRG
jgi:aminoglycoside 6'-N-acetyltransferase